MFTVPSPALLTQLAHGIAAQFGPKCEVVIHDLTSEDHTSTIVAIENGHVTGRKPGDGPSHVVLEALHSVRSPLQDHLAYLTRTQDGKILKSSTLFLRDNHGEVVAIFGINYDITLLLAAQGMLEEMTAIPQPEQEPEPICQNVSDLLNELINQSVRRVGKPVALMTREDKIRAVRFLNDTGAFLITKSSDKISKFFGISKYTLYSYLDESKS